MHLNISDEFLIQSYKKAVKLDLSSQFLELLKEEIQRRGLTVDDTKEEIEKNK
jgi:hypothetical protein